jgi:hypothetical protein
MESKLKKIDVRANFSPFFGFNKTALSINDKIGSAENLNTGLSVY